jgi:hypothetical protein
MDSSSKCGIMCHFDDGLKGQDEKESDMESTTIAVDLAKSVFQVAVSNRPGHITLERRL